jgi:hypothetical protein
MRGVPKTLWSESMKKENDAASMPHGYVLSEAQHEQLQQLCDNLFLMAEFVLAATVEEENELLQIKRSRLGWLFESFGFRLEHIMEMLERPGRHSSPPQKH